MLIHHSFTKDRRECYRSLIYEASQVRLLYNVRPLQRTIYTLQCAVYSLHSELYTTTAVDLQIHLHNKASWYFAMQKINAILQNAVYLCSLLTWIGKSYSRSISCKHQRESIDSASDQSAPCYQLSG